MTLARCKLREKALSAPYTKIVFAFVTVSFFTASIYNNYIGIGYALLSYAIVICGLYLRSVMTQSLFRRAMDTVCVCSIWCMAVALIQKTVIFAAEEGYRPPSVFDNANYYGMMIEFIIAIALYRFFTNQRHPAFYLMVIGVNLIGLYLCASFSSFLAMCAAAGVILVGRRNAKVSALFFGLMAACLLVIIAFPSLLPRSSSEIEFTLTQRLSIWISSLRAFKRTPFFGRGPETYRMVWEQFGGPQTCHCHNLFLDMLLNYGIFGTAIAFTYFILQGRLLLLRYRYGFCRSMDLLISALTVAVLVHGLTDVTILWIQTICLLFLVTSSMGIGADYVEERSFLPQLLRNDDDSSARLSV